MRIKGEIWWFRNLLVHGNNIALIRSIFEYNGKRNGNFFQLFQMWLNKWCGFAGISFFFRGFQLCNFSVIEIFQVAKEKNSLINSFCWERLPHFYPWCDMVSFNMMVKIWDRCTILYLRMFVNGMKNVVKVLYFYSWPYSGIVDNCCHNPNTQISTGGFLQIITWGITSVTLNQGFCYL